MLGYLRAIRPVQTGVSCGVRELAPVVCRPGLPRRAPRINPGTSRCPCSAVIRSGVSRAFGFCAKRRDAQSSVILSEVARLRLYRIFRGRATQSKDLSSM